jgi:hypothetical protein
MAYHYENNELTDMLLIHMGNVISRVKRKIVGGPHQSATASHHYLFAASVNRGSFYNTNALHWIVMVGGILDAFTIFRLSLVIRIHLRRPESIYAE